jgi:hypothetical protein
MGKIWFFKISNISLCRNRIEMRLASNKNENYFTEKTRAPQYASCQARSFLRGLNDSYEVTRLSYASTSFSYASTRLSYASTSSSYASTSFSYASTSFSYASTSFSYASTSFSYASTSSSYASTRLSYASTRPIDFQIKNELSNYILTF